MERRSIYIPPFSTHAYSQSAQTWIRQFYLQTAPCLLFLRKRSPDGSAPNWGSRHRIAWSEAYYSFIDPEGMWGWLSWRGWLTCSGWLSHISGHPSATGRAHDSESTPAKDRRSTARPRNPTTQKFLNCPTKTTARSATVFTLRLLKKIPIRYGMHFPAILNT